MYKNVAHIGRPIRRPYLSEQIGKMNFTFKSNFFGVPATSRLRSSTVSRKITVRVFAFVGQPVTKCITTCYIIVLKTKSTI